MSDPVHLQLEGLEALQAILGHAPAQFQAVVAQMLNDLAFRWRPLSVSHLASRFIMRSPRFVLSRMHVDKAKPEALEAMQARVGSTYVRGKSGKLTFDGFARIAGHEIGETRARTFTLAARGGEETKITKAGTRLKTDVPVPDDWDDVRNAAIACAGNDTCHCISKRLRKNIYHTKGQSLHPRAVQNQIKIRIRAALRA